MGTMSHGHESLPLAYYSLRLSTAHSPPAYIRRMSLHAVGSLRPAALIFGFFLFATGVHATSRNLLVVSDIHFNPMDDPALVSQLAAADPANWAGILQQSQPAAFSPYGKDTNWWLLQSALDAMPRVGPHPAVILFTGDLLAHNFPRMFQGITHDSDPDHYRAFVGKTVRFIALEMRRRFPEARILITPGNNDDLCGDYAIEAGGEFLSDTAGTARDLARADERLVSTWKSLGSFSVAHPTIRGLRIVSLNSVFFSRVYRPASFRKGCAAADSTAAKDLFTWLEAELKQAQAVHEKVWLMFHIPPGIDGWASSHAHEGDLVAESCPNSIVPMWVPQWTTRFDELLAQYEGTVIAGFAGHIHSDAFRLPGGNQFVLIDPAISPIYGQNPGFRVVEVNRDGTLKNQRTYYLKNLQTAGSTSPGEWGEEYNFARKWQQRRLDGAALAKVNTAVMNSKTAEDQWLKFYNVSSTADPVPAKDVRGLSCATASLEVPAYQACYCGGTPGGASPRP